MRRDTQIGIILGATILVIIGVFLSTRSSVKEPVIPESIKAEDEISEIEEIDISDLAKGLKDETTEEIVSGEDLKEDGTFIEGKWEGIETGVVEKEEGTPETNEEDEFEELIATLQDIPEEEEEEEQITPVVSSKSEVTHKVVPSDSLSGLSVEYYGSASKWKEIYKANKDKISNPNTLRVGMVLQIPDISSLEKEEREIKSGRGTTVEKLTGGKTHTVRAGDSLYKLAKQYYDDPAMWQTIYNANKDTMKNKNSLKIGQKLIIP